MLMDYYQVLLQSEYLLLLNKHLIVVYLSIFVILYFRVFFEKSRIPVEELRHIWQLCDVTRDGALDLAEFTSAMHLVVLRRNNIPIPSTLPTCLQPSLLHKHLGLPHKETAEADLLNLESDDNQDAARIKLKNDYQRMITSNYDEYSGPLVNKVDVTVNNKSATLPKNHHSQYRLDFDDQKVKLNNNNMNLLNNNNTTTASKTIIINKNVIQNNTSNNNNNTTSTTTTTSTVQSNRSSSNSPQQSVTAIDGASSGDGLASDKGNKEWTKFTESPTSNVSSPGPKPVNVTQAIVSDTHVIHPVPLRVTPVGPEVAEDDAIRTFRKADSLVYESGIMKVHRDGDGDSPKHYHKKHQAAVATGYNLHQRDSLPTDLRAIQRPQPKKSASKNIGAIPFLPEANQNISNSGVTVIANATNNSTIILSSKKEAPPLPPPRPHRHTRSSSLDLQKLKVSNNNVSQEQVGPPPGNILLILSVFLVSNIFLFS